MERQPDEITLQTTTSLSADLACEEIARLTRANAALDLLVKERDEQLRDAQANFNNLCLEFHDLNDELTRAKQDLELARLQLESARQAAAAAT